MTGRPGTTAAALVALAALAACSGEGTRPGEGPAPTTPSEATSSPVPTSAPPPSPTPDPPPPLAPDDVDVATAVRVVEVLAGRIGPRPGHTEAYARAAAFVQRSFEASGWTVRRQRFDTPGGVSWGVPVEAGPSVNVIATRDDVRPGRPWLLVGAHLDTVPQAPGAEDNASGVGVLLALAEALEGRRTRLPVVLVAFGSEEPRGPGDDDHHYGSRAYVAALEPAERRSLRGAVSLDRVGVGDVVPVGSAGPPDALSRELEVAARRAGVPTVADPDQRSSDHWSFVRDGLPGARLGSTSYGAYHSPDDVPAVVDRAQLARVARLMASWLGGPPAP